jgi:hypothetical protein
MEGRSSARAHITNENLDNECEYLSSDSEEEHEENDYGEKSQGKNSFKDDEQSEATVELLRIIKGTSTPGQENLTDNTLTENWNLADGKKENYIPKVVGGTCDETSVITTLSKAKQNFVDTQSVYTNSSSSKNKRRSAITDDEKNPTASSSKPITANTSAKKPRGVAYDTSVEEYRFKKELLAKEAAQEVRRHNRDACDENRRHNRAMEDIAYTTVRMETEKVNLEMLAIAKASQLDTGKKELELKIQKYNTFLSLKKRNV